MKTDLRTSPDPNHEKILSRPGIPRLTFQKLSSPASSSLYFNSIKTETVRQLTALLPALVKYYTLPVLLLAGLVPLNFTEPGRNMIARITRDPVAILNGPFYTGFISNIGILAWSASAALCLFSAIVLRKVARSEGKYGWASFLTFAGILTALLCLDDFFMVHDRVFPNHLKVSETPLFVFYMTMTGYMLVKYRRLIQKTDFLILFLAFGFFAASLFVDSNWYFSKNSFWGGHLFEDGFKFLGILSWFFYFLRTCLKAIRQELGERAF